MGARTPHELMRARRGVVHPRLRRDGRPLVADPHRVALGALPRPRRHARARRRRLALPPQPAQGRRRRRWSSSSGPSRRTSCRCPVSTHCPAVRPNRSHVRSARRSSAARPRHPRCRACVTARAAPAAVAAHRRRCWRWTSPRSTNCAVPAPTPTPGCGAPRVDVLTEHLPDGYAAALLARAGRRRRRGAPRRGRRYARTRRGAARPGRRCRRT